MIKSPVICVDGGDIIMFPFARDATAYIEPQDAEEGDVYDAEGHRLEMKAGMVSVEHHFLWFRWTGTHRCTMITEVVPAIDEASVLRGKLISYLRANKHPLEELENDPLSALVAKAGKHMPWRMEE